MSVDDRDYDVDVPCSEIGIRSVPEEIVNELEIMELEVYEDWRKELAQWALDRGRNQEFGKGYAVSTVRVMISNIDQFAMWVWDRHGFTTSFDTEMADEYWHSVLKPNDNKLRTNRRRANAIQLIFAKDGEGWSIPNSKDVYEQIHDDVGNEFTDWLTHDELEKVKTASLRTYAVPRRSEMTTDEKEEWTAHLSQRLRKPKHELTDEDWELSANSYKIPSLVYTSCDVGFRPAEVERARVQWFNLDERMLEIPKDESTKNSDHWRCYLSDETTRLLRKWKEERAQLPKYDGTNTMWLTREGNPYSGDSLGYLMERLMEEAGIDTENRETGWYMIRRGVGTDIASKKGVTEVRQQLRLTDLETAKHYIRHDERSMRDYFKSR